MGIYLIGICMLFRGKLKTRVNFLNLVKKPRHRVQRYPIKSPETSLISGILGSDLGIRLQEFPAGWFSSYSSDIPAILAHKQSLVHASIWRRFWND